MEDGRIIEEIRRGNIGAFEVLVKKYQTRLRYFAYRLVRDDHEAADVTQETFISVYKTLDRVDPRKKFSTYLFAIAKNKAMDILRRKKRETRLGEHVPTEEVIYNFQFTINNYLDRLEKKYKSILLLRYWEDLSYAQISRQLQLPLNTVRIQLHRAKSALKKLL